MKNIIVCGGDLRNYYLCLSLIENGHNVRWVYAENFSENESFIDRKNKLSDFEVIILPLPLSRDGENLNTPLSDKKIKITELEKSISCPYVFTSDDRIKGINYFKDEAVTTDNARLTAVGLLKELLSYEKEDIMGKNALITGYGRVSCAVSDILSKNGVSVTVAARNRNQRHTARARGLSALNISEAENFSGAYDYVINTVPHGLFSGKFFENANSKTAFFELASSMLDRSNKAPKAYIECKGMPGKHTPKSAGKVIADFVCQKLKE